jgi:PAS domain S-box-containing protein
MPRTLAGLWLMSVPGLLAIQFSAWSERERLQLERLRDLLEQRVAERTERYRIVSELSSDYSFAFRIDANRRVRGEWVTDALMRITGYQPAELEGHGWTRLVEPEDIGALVERLDALVAGRYRTEALRFRVLTKDGRERWLHVRFASVHDVEGGWRQVIGAASDVTEQVRAEHERRRLDLRMLETQRLESLGRMAGGIAHDFNNLLTVIAGNAELELEAARASGRDTRRLRRIRAAAAYAADLTGQVLTYSGQGAVELQTLDLAKLVEGMLSLLEAALPEGVELDVRPSRELEPLFGDGTQLGQVLLNLVSNAGEAIGPGPGRVTICLGERDFAAEEVSDGFGAPDPRAGRYVFLEVRDSGEGLAASEVARVFEPFFSTRGAGRGRGLAAALGIVRAHRGVVCIESEKGRGSLFRVLLPRDVERATAAPPTSQPGAASGTNARVLLVDDDDGVREVAREFLSRDGFDVREAAGGEAALDLVRRVGGDIDVVVLDLVMPDLSGEETLRALRELEPGLPVVLASGYDCDQAAERFARRSVAAFVRKPYDAGDLVASVRSALSA